MEEQVSLCIENLVPNFMYELKIKSPNTITKLIEKGTSIEYSLIHKGILKMNKDNTNMNLSTNR